MSDTAYVDPQVVDAINQIQAAVLTEQVVRTAAAGKAYQAVAQSAALAVQDAADMLRNVGTVATTASAVALSQFLASGDPSYLEAIDRAQAMVDKAIADYSAVGAASAALVKNFPSG
jgi:phage-related tail fiber protein